ncbi:unnamed protein product [Rangifer tarandus platyrhynchus]|uniref:Uncharacterized protein n=2 Tax=Rangifer tarandus platyrhynchus TaxID=3082113 RepID=A0ACB0EQZ3_RANTA|nr:unnamed protein product [Rangifer tarandus platyrhynchus]CAI9703102.1 unnamed protein product [Rangifer tarandus platyrhynchus]
MSVLGKGPALRAARHLLRTPVLLASAARAGGVGTGGRLQGAPCCVAASPHEDSGPSSDRLGTSPALSAEAEGFVSWAPPSEAGHAAQPFTAAQKGAGVRCLPGRGAERPPAPRLLELAPDSLPTSSLPPRPAPLCHLDARPATRSAASHLLSGVPPAYHACSGELYSPPPRGCSQASLRSGTRGLRSLAPDGLPGLIPETCPHSWPRASTFPFLGCALPPDRKAPPPLLVNLLPNLHS